MHQRDEVATAHGASTGVLSNAQPLQHLVVLSVLSFGLYPSYWLYRNLQLLKAHERLSISPVWRTFLAFIPLIGWPIFKDQLQLFAETAAAAGVESAISPWPHTLGFQLVGAAAWLLPLPWGACGTAAVLFLLPTQRTLNAYWRIEQPAGMASSGYSIGEVALAAVCAVLWALMFAAL
jgi:hypothetical protein